MNEIPSRLVLFLTHYCPVFLFYTPRKHQKTVGFMMFTEGTKMEHWAVMGLGE